MVGAVDGCAVLSQHVSNVVPSKRGQQLKSAGRPASTHRGWLPHFPPVGAPLGLVVGKTLGLIEGAADGLEGDADGNALGNSDGLMVGLVVGVTVGDALGTDDGEVVGASELSQQSR